MSLFGWRMDAIRALKMCNDELRRMHELLYSNTSLEIDMTKTEIMDRIVILQDTVNEGVRRLCGLEY
jgi:hypothetical protein